MLHGHASTPVTRRKCNQFQICSQTAGANLFFACLHAVLRKDCVKIVCRQRRGLREPQSQVPARAILSLGVILDMLVFACDPSTAFNPSCPKVCFVMRAISPTGSGLFLRLCPTVGHRTGFIVCGDRPRPMSQNRGSAGQSSSKIHALPPAHDFGKVKPVLDQLQPKSIGEYSRGIREACRSQDWRGTLSLFDRFCATGVTPDRITFNVAISACTKGRQWNRALSLLAEMRSRDVIPDVISFSSAISACEKSRQLEPALLLLEKMRAAQVSPGIITFNAAISACEKGRHWERALLLLAELRGDGLKPNTITFNAVISACEKGRNWERAHVLLNDMRSMRVIPNTISFNAVISACERNREWQQALILLSDMDAVAVKPDVISFSAAISACEKSSQWAQALILLHRLRKAQMTPDMIIFSAAISACEKGGQWQQALSLVQDMRVASMTPDVIGFSAAISACEKGGQWHPSLLLLNEMKSKGVTPNVISFSAVISACEKSGEWQRAVSFLHDMREASVTPNTISLNAAISACAKERQWHQSLLLLEELRESAVTPDIISFSAAISACENAMQWEQALSLFEELQQSGVPPDTISWNAAISACEKGRQWQRGLSLLKDMNAAGMKDVVGFSAAISACEKGTRWERALFVFDEMKESSMMPDVIAFSAAVSACEKGRQWQQALFLLGEMRATSVTPVAGTFSAAMTALLAANELEEGFQLLQVFEEALRAGTCSIGEAYPVYLLLLQACRLAKDSRALQLQSTIDQKGFSELLKAAVATASLPPGVLHTYENGYEENDERKVAEATAAMHARVMRQTSYLPRFEALPLGFTKRAAEQSLVTSLALHAEKKALADLIRCDGSDGGLSSHELELDINFHVCLDCHDYLKAASVLLQRNIKVREPKLVHVFQNGVCSCGDAWRWEERARVSQQVNLLPSNEGLSSASSGSPGDSVKPECPAPEEDLLPLPTMDSSLADLRAFVKDHGLHVTTAGKGRTKEAILTDVLAMVAMGDRETVASL